MRPTQVRVLTLEADFDGEHNLYRLRKGWKLRLTLGASLMGRTLSVWSTHPEPPEHVDTPAPPPPYKTFHRVAWTQGSSVRHDDLAAYAELGLFVAGAFKFQVRDDEIADGDKQVVVSGHFQVAPDLTVGDPAQPLPLDAIQCLTHLTKLLGPFSQWNPRLRVAKECGYNMIHLTPVQQLGVSNSSYSIADHTKLNASMKDNDDGAVPTYEEMAKFVEYMRVEWKVLTICDVVWNHISPDCPALKECPDFAYNMRNAAYMRPAFVLDRALRYFGEEVAANKYAAKGLPAAINQYHHLDALCEVLRADLFPKLKLHEFFQVDVGEEVKKFLEHIQKTGGPSEDKSEGKKLQIILDDQRRRLRSTVDSQLALSLFNVHRPECGTEADRAVACVAALTECLHRLNAEAAAQTGKWTMEAVAAVRGHVEYERVASHGPKIADYSAKHPLLTCYFSCPNPTGSWQGDEQLVYTNVGAHCVAFNGWVMGDDPLRNFAEPPADVYLRRALICWGDCVKLRYGPSRDTCPRLWDYMRDYTRNTAATFHGLRLDNCHSTPLHVAEYLLSEARAVRPELYVVAELFTGSEQLDNIFVNHLGITSLIREAQVAPDAHEEGRLVYKYGGEPVGAFMERAQRPLEPMIAHALFMDLTHDNKCPIETRTVFDYLPTAGVVSSACCATGSTRGYDELVPYHINVVTEKRLYTMWTDDMLKSRQPGNVGKVSGIMAGKRALNDLHRMLAVQGYTQVFVDQMTADIVAVTRHNPVSLSTVVIVSRCCFDESRRHNHGVPAIHVSGVVDEVLFELNTVESPARRMSRTQREDPAAAFVHGLPDYTVNVRCNFKWDSTDYIRVRDGVGYEQIIEMNQLTPGSVIAFKIGLSTKVSATMSALRLKLASFGFRVQSLDGEELRPTGPVPGASALRPIVDKMSLVDLNRALFRCEAEEADDGGGAYDVPGWGKFPYCGIQGLLPDLMRIRRSNDLGHPLCGNLRAGDWLAGYVANRLKADPATQKLGEWYAEVFSGLPEVPHYLKPSAFDAIIAGSYLLIRTALFEKMSKMVNEGSEWVKALALATVAFMGRCRSAPLPPVDASIPYHGASLSAGLPHFATGIWRNWGRDTFIALPGCLLVTGRYSEAREIILAYAGMLRHGLIPNLLGDGKCTRYNCRDAVWFWLYAIKRYCELAPEPDDAYGLLKAPVRRMFTDDDQMYGCPERVEPLHVTMQEALDRHFAGIEFRERNAGHMIDEHMQDEGFNMRAYIHRDWGFVMGGNRHNCGTWMDKMGSSSKAGNRGVPATPRDGAAAELQGLAYAVARWLQQAHEHGHYPNGGLHDKKETWTWSQWADKIQANFQLRFWVPKTVDELPEIEHNEKKFVHRRGIVKDTYGASDTWPDFQLRPNMCIALALAPDLLNVHDAWHALCVADDVLMGEIGVKTLDPRDGRYNGFYNNNDQSDNFFTANGFNYHNGPEWVWVCGYLLRARLAVGRRMMEAHGDGRLLESAVREIKRTLARHRVHLLRSPWRSLPELTNENGAACGGSCEAQAWSVGCILEVLHDMQTTAT